MFVFFGGVMLMMLLSASSGNGDRSTGMPFLFVLIFLLHVFTMLEMFILIAFYIIHLFKNDRIPNDKKALWAIVIFCGSLIAMPVYWYLYIWKTPPASRTLNAET